MTKMCTNELKGMATNHKVQPLVRLDGWFQLDEPGTYTVQVRRRNWQGGQSVLMSGPVTFVIVEKTEDTVYDKKAV